MSNSEIADTLSYLTDEQLLQRWAEEKERFAEQRLALERTRARMARLGYAAGDRGLQ